MSRVTDKSGLSLKFASRFREAERFLKDPSPEILNRYRDHAMHDFIRSGVPDRKDENYRYTDLQPALDRDYAFPFSRDTLFFLLEEVFKCDIPQLDTTLVLLLNGWFRYMTDKKTLLPEGVVAGSLKRMASEYPGLMAGYYARLADTRADAMVALNTAFAQDGYFLFIPRNTVVEQPIQVINLLQSDSDTFITQRNLVVVEPGAEVKLLVCDHTQNLNHYFSNSVTEIFAGENATVDFCTVQNQHNQSVAVHSVFSRLERDAHLTTHTITLHGGLVRNNLEVMMDGENAEANLYGMAFMDRRQHVDNFTRVIHAQPHCTSNQHYKNVLDDESTGAFSGRIHVWRDAQKTNAYQRNNSLLLNGKAKMQTKPQLIIEADDVKCSHGATVGQIDGEALFYLRSRGIEEPQARLMMMNAFSYEVVQKIRIEPLRDRISELVDRRLRGDVGRCHACAYHCDC